MNKETKKMFHKYYVLLLLFMTYNLGTNPVMSFQQMVMYHATETTLKWQFHQFDHIQACRKLHITRDAIQTFL